MSGAVTLNLVFLASAKGSVLNQKPKKQATKYRDSVVGRYRREELIGYDQTSAGSKGEP